MSDSTPESMPKRTKICDLELDKDRESEVSKLSLSDSTSESMPKLTKICDLVIDKDPKREVSKPSLSDFVPKLINCEPEGGNEECDMQVGRCSPIASNRYYLNSRVNRVNLL